LKSNFLVGRLDHDFSEKWHFMTTYRYYKQTKAVDNQVDIAGSSPATSWVLRLPQPAAR